MRDPRRGALAACAALLVILPVSPPAWAHFLLNVNLRTIHVEALDDGFRVFIRLPMPLVVATPEHARNPEDPFVVMPYTQNRVVNGRVWAFVDAAKVQANPMGLGRLVAGGHSLVAGGQKLPGRIEAVRVHDARGILAEVPLFSTLPVAKTALRGPVYSSLAQDLPVGDALVDVAIFYPHAGPKESFLFSSSLAPELPGAELTENLLRFYRLDGTVSIYRARGALRTPMAGGASALAFAATFVVHGTQHILGGWDHLLFVLCLILGARALRGLVWQATGFTLGHSVTLVAGVLGYVPRFSWFVPAVETGIALSIIYVACVALSGRARSATLLATTLVGLLHGFGFSFLLSEILTLDSSYLALGLVSFNVGIELGQLGVVLLVWPALRCLDRRAARLSRSVRAGLAYGSIGVAALAVGTRSVALLHSV